MYLFGCNRYRSKNAPLMGAFMFLLAISASGCSSVPTLKVADAELETKWLPFVNDGSTTKQDALLKLGLPAAHFEGERILVYRLILDEKDGLVPVSRYADPQDPRIAQWPLGHYNLVLVFDDNHVLKRHSLLKVR